MQFYSESCLRVLVTSAEVNRKIWWFGIMGFGDCSRKVLLEEEEKFNYGLKGYTSFSVSEDHASLPFVVTEGEVPGSAVLVFDIELLELVSGLPEGYMFVWNGEVSPNLFEEIDQNHDGEVLLEEVS